MRRPPRVVTRTVNRLAAALLRSRWHGLISGRVLLLTFAGRRSGRTITTPVSYWRDGDALVIRTRSSWGQNLRDGAPVTVLLEGRELRGWAAAARPAPGAAPRTVAVTVLRITLGPAGPVGAVEAQ